jgi:hypothetical protein
LSESSINTDRDSETPADHPLRQLIERWKRASIWPRANYR